MFNFLLLVLAFFQIPHREELFLAVHPRMRNGNQREVTTMCGNFFQIKAQERQEKTLFGFLGVKDRLSSVCPPPKVQRQRANHNVGLDK